MLEIFLWFIEKKMAIEDFFMSLEKCLKDFGMCV